jgi:FkbH-like protein
MLNFNQLKKELKKNPEGLKVIKVAILGDYATQFVRKALEGAARLKGYNLEVFEADYNQIDQQIENPVSEFYNFDPQYTFITQSSQKLLKKFYTTDVSIRGDFASQKTDHLNSLIQTIRERTSSKIILDNYVLLNDNVFGNFSNKTEISFNYQQRKLQFQLMELAAGYDNVFILDLVSLQAQYGNNELFDAKMYINADIVYSLDFIPKIAYSFVDIIASCEGKFKKCLILDLDNTTWGGIIGDDGIENIQVGDLGIGKAFTELQLWAKELKNRGIILGICSKNTDHIAREPFEKHPEMILRLEDISIFVANWENKADNIRYIQEVLNIGFDSMVFLDDNPFERNIVRNNIPDITVPELPEDPAEYLPYLRTLNLFETASYSENDQKRTAQYKEQAKRAIDRKKFTNVGDFLKNMEMTSLVEGFTKFNTPRVSQLSQRSNQFNLRTVRYSEQEINQLQEDDTCIDLTFTLDDKYGENGLIAILITKVKGNEAFIDSWIMSCRVLKRGMENFVLNTLVEQCKLKGVNKIIGEYIPTPKNALVENHYKDLGFSNKEGNLWEIDVPSYEERECFIKQK